MALLKQKSHFHGIYHLVRSMGLENINIPHYKGKNHYICHQFVINRSQSMGFRAEKTDLIPFTQASDKLLILSHLGREYMLIDLL